jgi:hypothetical protein
MSRIDGMLQFQAFFILLMTAVFTPLQADPSPLPDRFADQEKMVAATHASAQKLREESLRKTIAKDSAWPSGVWGENLWCLSALYLNEKTARANELLLKRAEGFLASDHKNLAKTSPEDPGTLPWTFFSITDYVRILGLFHAKSPHFPGRLTAETEAAMKESLWHWVRAESRLDYVNQDSLFVLLGTENHDLNRRPPCYLITAWLNEDATYRNRKLNDGHSVAEHAAAYTRFFREWPRQRAQTGLWIEVGSNTYQKYSWPALFNLHELSPDPIIRHRFGLLLDLACIEEAQISVRGRRGGGLSRADDSANSFAGYKNLLFAREGQGAASSHSRVIETSRFQAPAAAILLEKMAFPAAVPFAVRNRVLGKQVTRGKDGEAQGIDPDSALVNYAWRSPHYLLGSTLQNPTLTYAGISRQKRWCGLLFDDPTAKAVGSIGIVIEKTGAGRPQHSFWSVQHQNVLLIQRIADHKEKGAYSTGMISVRFDAPDLQLSEQEGWIFASNGKAFAAIKFLDGGHRWDKERKVASPANFRGEVDTGRILLHAGDVTTHGSFAHFCESLLTNTLDLSADTVTYRYEGGKQRIDMFRYDFATPAAFRLPLINGQPLNLHPATTYDSPYLKGDFRSDRISVRVGPLRQVLDFASTPPKHTASPDKEKTAFTQAAAGEWKQVFSDPCTGDWRKLWFLDGEVGKIETGPNGMTLTAGPEFRNESHHMVLWTKQSFSGDLKIEYDYTRTDHETRCVNILYIQATGSGKGPYATDITRWNELRKVPAMDLYFNHMHAYHLSYAAYPMSGEQRISYLRARRYMPEAEGLKGTEMIPEYDPEGFFAQGVTHHISVVKKERELFIRVENPHKVGHFHFTNARHPVITEGRVGLRHMFTRSARYANFHISTR